MTLFYFVSFLLFISATFSHPTIYPKSEIQSMGFPAFKSWHIHVQFVNDSGSGNQSVAATLKFREEFMNAFKDTLGAPCTGLLDQGRLCMFDVDMHSAGPFVGPQWAVFVPLQDFNSTFHWCLQNRFIGDQTFTLFVHPNSGYALEDHTKWAVWSGDPWPLIPSIFSH